jgi:hypothetical protein
MRPTRPQRLTHYYRCNGQRSYVTAVFGVCPGRYLKQEWIEGLVWNELQDWILHHTNLEEIITEALQEQDRQRQEWRDTSVKMQAELRLKEEERERIVTAYQKGVLSNNDLERQLAEIEKEKQTLSQATADLEKRHDLHIDVEQAVAPIRQQLGSFRKAIQKGTVPFSVKRQIVETFVKEVRVRLRKGRKALPDSQQMMVTETIPFRPNSGEVPSDAECITVWERQADRSQEGPVNEEGVQVIYRFPFPPKPKTLIAITDCIGAIACNLADNLAASVIYCGPGESHLARRATR